MGIERTWVVIREYIAGGISKKTGFLSVDTNRKPKSENANIISPSVWGYDRSGVCDVIDAALDSQASECRPFKLRVHNLHGPGEEGCKFALIPVVHCENTPVTMFSTFTYLCIILRWCPPISVFVNKQGAGGC